MKLIDLVCDFMHIDCFIVSSLTIPDERTQPLDYIDSRIAIARMAIIQYDVTGIILIQVLRH